MSIEQSTPTTADTTHKNDGGEERAACVRSAKARERSEQERGGGRAAACVSQRDSEPLDPNSFRYQSQRQFDKIAADSEIHRLPDSYKSQDGFDPTTLGEAQNAIAERLVGEAANDGWHDTRRSRTRYAFKRILHSDRKFRQKFDDFHTALVSLRVCPEDWPLATLFDSVASVGRDAIKRINHYLDDWGYASVMAGTDRYGTPHLHVLFWVDGEVTPETFEPMVNYFVTNCPFAPSDGTGNRIEEGAVTVRGPRQELARAKIDDEKIEKYGACTAGAHYVANQLPYLAFPAEATQAELWFDAAADVAECDPWSFSVNTWSTGEREPTPPTMSLGGRREKI